MRNFQLLFNTFVFLRVIFLFQNWMIDKSFSLKMQYLLSWLSSCQSQFPFLEDVLSWSESASYCKLATLNLMRRRMMMIFTLLLKHHLILILIYFYCYLIIILANLFLILSQKSYFTHQPHSHLHPIFYLRFIYISFITIIISITTPNPADYDQRAQPIK